MVLLPSVFIAWGSFFAFLTGFEEEGDVFFLSCGMIQFFGF